MRALHAMLRIVACLHDRGVLLPNRFCTGLKLEECQVRPHKQAYTLTLTPVRRPASAAT